MHGPHTAQRGVTLVELMIATTIGLLVMLVVGTTFVQGSRATAEDDRYARMIENARFAADAIATDLRMVSFWGEMLDPGAVTTSLTAGADCGIGLFNGNSAVLYNNGSAVTPTTQFDVTTNECRALTGTLRGHTNQLAVKHVSGIGLATGALDGIVYLRSNGSAGSLINNAATTPLPTGYQDWQYVPTVYYVADDDHGVPSLCRLRASGLGFAANTPNACLAGGIEQFHIQFGIDTDRDGVVNQYKSNPTAAEMAAALTARIYVLARSANTDVNYTNNKTYTLGDLVVNGGGDHYYRRVFSSTVRLRNPANRLVLK